MDTSTPGEVSAEDGYGIRMRLAKEIMGSRHHEFSHWTRYWHYEGVVERCAAAVASNRTKETLRNVVPYCLG